MVNIKSFNTFREITGCYEAECMCSTLSDERAVTLFHVLPVIDHIRGLFQSYINYQLYTPTSIRAVSVIILIT